MPPSSRDRAGHARKLLRDGVPPGDAATLIDFALRAADRAARLHELRRQRLPGAHEEPFSAAWNRALGEVDAAWAQVLVSQAEAWRRAFAGEPATQSEWAIAVLASSHLGKSWGMTPHCRFCSVAITGVDGAYCSPACERAHEHDRARRADRWT